MTGHVGYRSVAAAYRQAGWQQVIPLPHAAKTPPPAGTTGSRQTPVTSQQVQQWMEDEPADQPWNVGVIMPTNVIALDIDQAAGHERKEDGATTLRQLEQELGTLPPTWTSGHTNGMYGHRFYRVPTGMEFEGGAGPGIDILQHHHRYAVAYPSIHPDGSQYQWHTPDGQPARRIPQVGELPLLPDTWIRRLRKQPTRMQPRRIDTTPLRRMDDDPRMCRAINRYLDKLLANPAGKGSRHDTMLQAAWALVRFQEEGHKGALDALAQLKPYFLREVAPDRKGGEREAETEYNRIVASALEKNTGIQGVTDPCSMSRIERLTPQETSQLNQTRPLERPSHPVHATPATATSIVTGGNDTTTPTVTTVGDTETGMPADSTWLFLDLSQLAQGVDIPPQPTVYEREDGQGLFYKGCVNDIHGEPGTGKSLLAQTACAQELKARRHVIYIDYEDRARNVVKRLLLLGVPARNIIECFHYVNPQASNIKPTSRQGWEQTLEYAGVASLCVIDGVTASLTFSGCESNDSDDVVAWFNSLPRRIARMGAAVVLVDHVVKTKDNRGRYASGSMQKLAQIDGISYSITVEKPLGKGLKGVIVMRSGKDRIGDIEEKCAPGWSEGHLREAARITIDSTDPKLMRVQVGIPNRMPHEDGRPAEPFRPTGLMERLSRIIEDNPMDPTQSEVFEQAKGDGSSARTPTMRRALKTLVDEEFLSSRVGERNRIYYHSLKPYRQMDDPESDSYQSRLSDEEKGSINGYGDDDEDPEF